MVPGFESLYRTKNTSGKCTAHLILKFYLHRFLNAFISYCCTVVFSHFFTAGNSLIRSLLIRSFTHFAQIKWATVSDSLRSLKTNERRWVNRSGRWEEMSDREWIAQVAQEKWATMSDSLRSLWGNEQISDLLKKCWLKKSKILF